MSEPIVAAVDPSAEAAEAVPHQPVEHGTGRGVLLAFVSAFFYTCTNVCVREVDTSNVYLVSCLKAVPTMLVAVVLVMLDERNGRERRPSRANVFWLIMTGLLSHIGGNVAFQWGLGVVGLAAAVPLTFSMIIVGGAVLGRFWLGEALTSRSVWAIGVLCASFVAVSLHAEEARTRATVTETAHDQVATALGVAAVCFSGVAFSVLGGVVRRTMIGSVGMSYMLLILSCSGVASLGPLALADLGLEGLRMVSLRNYAVMLAAGTFNAGGFLALARAMQTVPVNHVNVVNASQVAMAAAAGVALFHEPFTAWLAAGLILSTAGIVLNRRPAR